jgi:hypothetical protein
MPASLRLCQRLSAAALALCPLHLAAAEIFASSMAEEVRVAPRRASRVETSADSDVRIGLSPAAAQKAERAGRAALYRRTVAGDEAAKKSWQELAPAIRTAALADLAMTRESSVARKQAMQDLALQSPSDDPDATGVNALAAVAVADSQAASREMARNGVVARGDDRVIPPLVKALKHQDKLIQENAAAALKAIGGPRVFEVIIEHWKDTWGPGARSHVMFAQQRSYIADYDISGSAYDPVIKSFVSGVVLDVKPLRVEGDAYYYYIREIAPDNVNAGNNPVAWEKWLHDKKPALLKDAERKHAKALVDVGDIGREE